MRSREQTWRRRKPGKVVHKCIIQCHEKERERKKRVKLKVLKQSHKANVANTSITLCNLIPQTYVPW